jgi:hypothetical protein
VVEGVDRVNVSTTHLLMEGARLMDEANEPSLAAAPVSIPPKPPDTPPAPAPSESARMAAADSTDDGWD